jgi:hypothetical protein
MDYASVVLVDKRFSNEKIQMSLPKWIRDSFGPARSSFGATFRQLAAFHRKYVKMLGRPPGWKKKEDADAAVGKDCSLV